MRCIYEEKTKIYGHLSLVKSVYLIKQFYQQIIKKRQFDKYKLDVYATLTYYFIYYPILYQLERKNIFPLHASAVMTSGRGVLMPGLPGVGKSTLCLAFMSTEKAKFLSDNIVLYDADNVYSFFEPLKLDAWSFQLFSSASMSCHSNPGKNKKRSARIDKQKKLWQVKKVLILFLTFCTKH